MQIIATDTQSKWKDSFASSAQVRLTLRVNGEEEGTIITPDGTITKAGIVAPTVAIPAAVSITATPNTVPAGYYYYVYVYASSKYPFVENAVTGGGQLYPRSSPSPIGVVQHAAAPSVITVTLTKSTRTDMDKIWVYRTANGLDEASALSAATAGEYFYVGTVDSNGVAGTTTFADTNVANTGEILELDNYACPLFRFTVFDGTYWWGWGNVAFSQPCSIDGTTNVTLTGTDVEAQWFSGRDGSVCNFNGVISGGFDGKGSFYFKRLTINTGALYSDEALTTPVIVYATGTTTINIQTNPTTLYRSKIRNPFSWGTTTTFITDDGTTQVPQLYAQRFGGGTGTAISLITNDRILKLDCEGPTRSYALDLTAADGDAFVSTLRTLDETHSVGAHFSQFGACTTTGQSVLVAIDPKNRQIIQADSGSQIPLSTNVIRTLRKMVTSDLAPEFFHGLYNTDTELNVWWIKAIEPSAALETYPQLEPKITHRIYQHAPTGKWGVMPDFGILCSATIYDPVEDKTYTFTGSQDGVIAQAFVKDEYGTLMNNETLKSGVVTGGDIYPFAINANNATLYSSANLALSAVTAVDSTASVSFTLAPDWISVGDRMAFGDPFFNSFSGIVETLGTTTTLTSVIDESTGAPWTSVTSMPGGGSPVYAAKRFASIPYDTGASWNFVMPPTGGFGYWVKAIPYYQFPKTSIGITDPAWLEYIYIPEDLSDITETPPLNQAAGWLWFAGVDPSRIRRYFNAGNPEKSKRLLEMWATQQNIAADSSQFVRFFNEYEEAICTNGSIVLVRDKQGDNTTNSNVYLNKNQIPSNLKNSFGVEFIELGHDQYQCMDFTLKLNPA